MMVQEYDTKKNCNSLSNSLMVMKFGEIDQNDELHKLTNYFSEAAIPSKAIKD